MLTKILQELAHREGNPNSQYTCQAFKSNLITSCSFPVTLKNFPQSLHVFFSECQLAMASFSCFEQIQTKTRLDTASPSDGINKLPQLN